ncbi:MAG: type II/IV secretion system protein [Candidatus Portnoybacteria bacterium]|nr:type II/IV secretion system protein [Candidatus Portnoybacteria bacterium]
MTATNPKSKTKDLQEKLTQLRKQAEEKRAKQIAAQLNLPYLDLKVTPIETAALDLVEEEKAKKAKLAVIKKKGKQLWLASQDPSNVLFKEILEELKKAGYQINLLVATESGLKKAWAGYQELAKPPAKKITGQVEIAGESLEKLRKEIKNLDDIKKQIKGIPAGQASTIVEILLAGSLQTNASDLHLETEAEKINLRYRIDGLLQDVVFLSAKTYHFVLNRLKLLAGMKLNVHDKAQDGRFTISVDKTDMEIRVSCIPSAYGENIVMRILNPKAIALGLEDLGLRPDFLEVIQKEIQRPNGMLITTGPTSSGKTTLLYALLKKVNQPEVKIITLEDPVEYHLEGITQTQVETEKGYTFAKGLRAILRQDPDVILIGEIRDKETAEIAVQSALTGHLVFSTLHTNDAAGAIPRFFDIGVKASNLASALNLIMAQRLVRKVCQKCRQAVSPSEKQLSQIKKALTGLLQQVKQPSLNKDLKIYQAKGCPQCNQTGYQGRIGIFEMILINEEMEKLISASATHLQILEKAREQGLVSFYQDALLKVLEGITTLEEVKRVVGSQE